MTDTMQRTPIREEHRSVVIIGGGPAGLAAAIAAREAGAEDVLVLERSALPGGILNQCIHTGFGLHTFHEELTGPEYAGRFIERAKKLNIPVVTGTTVLELLPDRTVTAVSPDGLRHIRAEAVVLAMGCRERPRGALNIPGSRCAGVYTAGTAQRLINIEGFMPGKSAVILGSGDIGLIMARRLTLEGAKVHAVAELLPYSGGLRRNIVQCLDDFNIPLLLSHTVVNIHGRGRVEGITLAQVDDRRQPIPGTEEDIPCDTLLLSVGLIPENELSAQAGVPLSPVTGGPFVDDSLQTRVPGIFACGNVLHVHDLVDYVSAESARAGHSAALYAAGKASAAGPMVPVVAGEGVRYTVPVGIRLGTGESRFEIRFRVDGVYRGCMVEVLVDDRPVMQLKKRILVPGEMQTIILPAAHLQSGPKQVTVRVVPGAAQGGAAQ